MFFPSHYRSFFYTTRYPTELGLGLQKSPKKQSADFITINHKKIERTIASTLFLDTLIDFIHATEKIEAKITSRTPIWQDLSILEDHLREIRVFRRIINMRIRLIKHEITQMRNLLV